MAEVLHASTTAHTLQPVALPPLPPDPLVSILITNYNYAQFVREAIESALDQTYPRVEVVVCDDGSTDNSREILSALRTHDERIKLLLKENGGQGSAYNAGLAACNGDIICLLDSDDYFEPTKVESIVQVFRQQPTAGFCVHALNVVDSSRKPIQRIPFMTRFESGFLGDRLLRRGGRWRCMPSSALSFRREMLRFLLPVPVQEFRTDADSFAFTLLPLVTGVVAIDDAIGALRLHNQNAISSARFDERVASRWNDALRRTVRTVNERALQLDIPARLELDRNLDFLIREFVLALYRGEPRWKLFRDYLHLCRALLVDDMYNPLQKVLGIASYGLAILLPSRKREAWISATQGYGAVKRAVQRLLRRRRPSGKPPVLATHARVS